MQCLVIHGCVEGDEVGMASEGFPHTAPGYRVADGASMTVGLSGTGDLVVVMGYWLMVA